MGQLKKTSKKVEGNFVKMRDPAGNLRSVPKEQVLKAQEAGYRKAE